MSNQKFFDRAAYRKEILQSMGRNVAKVPSSVEVIQHSEEIEKIAVFNAKLELGTKKEHTIIDQLRAFTKSLNHRYIMDQRKAFMFEDSVMLYTWFLANPNAE